MKKCKICGCESESNYTVTVKQANKEVGTYTVCGNCLEHNCLIDSKPVNSDEEVNFDKEFERLFGNPFLGSDFI